MSPDEKRAYARTFPVHVGVDTDKTFHVLVAQGPDGVRTTAHKVVVAAGARCAAASGFRLDRAALAVP